MKQFQLQKETLTLFRIIPDFVIQVSQKGLKCSTQIYCGVYNRMTAMEQFNMPGMEYFSDVIKFNDR